MEIIMVGIRGGALKAGISAREACATGLPH